MAKDKIDMEGVCVNRNCLVMLADYAGNESCYQVAYNDGLDDFNGQMYGFTNVVPRGTANTWMEIDPDNVSYDVDVLDLIAEANDENATVEVDNPAIGEDGTAVVTIIVTRAEAPTDPEEPTEKPTEGDTPDTGERMDQLWLALLIVSLSGMVALVTARKKWMIG